MKEKKRETISGKNKLFFFGQKGTQERTVTLVGDLTYRRHSAAQILEMKKSNGKE